MDGGIPVKKSNKGITPAEGTAGDREHSLLEYLRLWIIPIQFRLPVHTTRQRGLQLFPLAPQEVQVLGFPSFLL